MSYVILITAKLNTCTPDNVMYAITRELKRCSSANTTPLVEFTCVPEIKND